MLKKQEFTPFESPAVHGGDNLIDRLLNGIEILRDRKDGGGDD